MMTLCYWKHLIYSCTVEATRAVKSMMQFFCSTVSFLYNKFYISICPFIRKTQNMNQNVGRETGSLNNTEQHLTKLSSPYNSKSCNMGILSFNQKISDIYLMRRDSNLWEMRRADSKTALVSSYGLLTFAVRTGFVEYVDEISPLRCIWVVFVLRFVSQAQLWADGGHSGA